MLRTFKALPMPAVMLCVLVIACPAWAGGIMLYEVGSDNTGLVNAGAAARAQGPSTIASNPAGIAYLEGTQISAGAQVIYGRVEFDADSSTNVPGSGSANTITPTPGGSFFITHRIDEHWSAGFGAYGDFGLALDYNNGWTGRYFSQYGSIAGLSLVPTVAYTFDDHWALGVGAKAMYGMLQTEAAIDRSPLGLSARGDGQYKYKDSDWGAGANIGLIYSPMAGTRIGLTYTSAINLRFEDRLNVKGSGVLLARANGIPLGLDVRVPQTATLSLYRQLNPRWALLATANWQDWSRFGDINVDVDTSVAGAVSSTVQAHYQDTYQLALGTQYQATPKWLWNAGVAHDTSAVSSHNRTVSNPMSAQWRLGTGVTYALDTATDLNLSWDCVWMGDLEVDQRKSLSGDRISGAYNNAWLQTITGNMTWRF